jgi:hypothetical protein
LPHPKSCYVQGRLVLVARFLSTDEERIKSSLPRVVLVVVIVVEVAVDVAPARVRNFTEVALVASP